MSEKEQNQVRLKTTGVKLMRINQGLIFFAAVLFALLMYAVACSKSDTQKLQAVNEQYMLCQQDAVLLAEASRDLTDDSRSFVQTGEIAFAESYADELLNVRRRERVREDEAQFELEEDVYYYLERALAHSDELTKTERYAMRLAQDRFGLSKSALPGAISRIGLNTGDVGLSPDQKQERARELLYDAAYQEHKAEISRLTDKAMSTLASDIRLRIEKIEVSLSHRRVFQQAVGLLLLLLVPAIVLMHKKLMISPLLNSIRRVGSREAMSVEGAQEMRELAAGYNDMLEENNARNAELSYSASHDALTGLFNRSAYDAAMKAADKRSICILIVDVDHFKQFNDRYGHDVGDLVLRRVAEEMKKTFRTEDHISRIGGDEFCVIIKNATSALSYLVRAKVNALNRTLSVYDGKIPPVSLSVGVAFGDRSEPDSLFKDADTALYRVKEAGRGGCEIF